MGRKWLDNYGQEENYNDSKISIPPGFVGQAYDVSGRNYSPAWGGQFQSGGNVESKWEYSNTNGKLIPIAQKGRNLKRLLNENIKTDSNTTINYAKLRNIDPIREIKKQTQKIENVQKKNNVSRKKALEIIQKEEFDKNVSRNPQSVGEITPVEDQSVASKTWEVLTNPVTAASYWLNDQRIPDNFSKGERNNLDIATDLFNPFGIINSGKNAVKETISIPKNLYNGEYGEAGSNFLNAGINTLSVMPALRELKGLKPIEIPKQLPDFGNVDDVGSMFKGHLTDKEKEMYRWFEKQLKIDALPNTKNKKTLDVLENFKTRIQTPEGKKRMKELGIDSDEMLQKIQIVEDPNTFGYFSGNRNKVVLNPSDPLSTQTARHEIEHGVQNALKQINKSNIDDLLSDLELRKQGTPNKQWIGHVDNDSPVNVSEYKSLLSNKQNATDYFLTGSDGREKSAFLGEVQQYMMDNNIIPKTSYKEVTPEMVEKVFMDAMFDEAGGGKYLRLFNIMKPTQKNYELVAKGLNKMLTVTGTIGVGAASQIEQKKEGGVIKDNNGYWNPDNWGKVVEIDSNDITMKGVNQPLLGISDEGDVQYMEPNKDYKFKGKKVREFPIAQKGKNIVSDQKQFLQSYVDSPMYLHRLRKQFGDEADKEQKIRSNTLKNVEINYPNFPIGTNYGSIAGMYITKKQRDDTINENKYSNTYGQYFKDIKFENPKNFKKGNIYLEKEYKHNIPANGFETVPIHEMGHALDDSGRNMKLDMIAAIYNRLQTGNDNELLDTGFDSVLKNKKPIKFKYETVPTEVSARLQSIRYLLNKTSIYDARKRQFNVKDYEKMINDPYIMNETATQDVINNLKGKNEKEKKENFIWLMNNVAKNNKTENLVPIARNGINNLDENSLQQLDQLTNFTNYNKLSTGGWLDKF